MDRRQRCAIGERPHCGVHVLEAGADRLFVVDGAIAIAGGRNLADEYFLRSDGANFIDLDVLLAGPVVTELGRAVDFD